MMRLIPGDCVAGMKYLRSGSVYCCVTSPPYFGLRDYGVVGQIGLELTPGAYVARLVEVFREVSRVLRDDGTLWLNLGDSYANTGGHTTQGETSQRKGRSNVAVQHAVKGSIPAGFKQKDLLGIPWMVAFALRAEGWYLRSDVIWSKPNPMPESVKDRPTKSHEYLFLLTKSQRYYYDSEAIKEPAVYAGQMRGGSTNRYEQNAAGMDNRVYDTRNKRTVWTVLPQPYKGAHFATFPPALIEPCVLAGCPAGGTVLDPFMGSGTTGAVCVKHGRDFVGIELNREYILLARKRIHEARQSLSAQGEVVRSDADTLSPRQ